MLVHTHAVKYIYVSRFEGISLAAQEKPPGHNDTTGHWPLHFVAHFHAFVLST